MLDLEDLRLMRAIGAAPSLAAAARLLDLTPPAVTTRLQRVEQRLKVRLAARGARGVVLTDEGQRLHLEAVELLSKIEALPSRIGGGGELLGSLRVVAPFAFGRTYVAPVIRDLHREHPSLQIALRLSDSPLTDAAGADVVVNIGPSKPSSWVGHLLAPNDRLLCASPAYARLLKGLSHPSQLPRYRCLYLRENDEDVTRWRFFHRGDTRKAVTVRIPSVLSSNDGTVIMDWALAGLGIVERSEWTAAGPLAKGQLVRVLPDWSLPSAPVKALLPSRTGVSPRQQSFLQALRRALAAVPWRHQAAGR